MVDFTPPFAQQGERRLPTLVEQQQGFPCGEAARELFNGMFWLLQGQVKNIADEAGVTPAQAGDLTVLKRAVLELINAATGGNPAGYVLMAQARARLPIYPEVLHEDGHFGVLSPSTGNVRVPAGRDFLHRGIHLETTVQEDFALDASKTYHLRWNPSDGFTINDLASGTYNPGALNESNVAFDTDHDDMLVARVITNSSNAVSVTNLINSNRLLATLTLTSTPYQADNFSLRADFTHALNWSRTPAAVALAPWIYASAPGMTALLSGGANRVISQSVTRYSIAQSALSDWNFAHPVSGYLAETRGSIIA